MCVKMMTSRSYGAAAVYVKVYMFHPATYGDLQIIQSRCSVCNVVTSRSYGAAAVFVNV